MHKASKQNSSRSFPASALVHSAQIFRKNCAEKKEKTTPVKLQLLNYCYKTVMKLQPLNLNYYH